MKVNKIGTRLVLAGCLMLFFGVNQVFATTFYVTPSGAGNFSGSSWANAAAGTSLQTIITNASNGDEVWVSAGTYVTTTGVDRSISFQMKTGVAIFGSFLGTETLLTQRNLSNGLTSILSGEIGDAGNSDNSYHVISNSNLDNSAVLDGFVIRDGNDNRPLVNSDGLGGGIFNFGNFGTCSPTIRNCLITENSASFGGGIFNSGYSGVASPIILNCVIAENTATSGGAGMDNFGLAGAANPTITNTVFYGNTASFRAGAIYNWGGNGGSANPVMINAVFVNNEAVDGGALVADNLNTYEGSSGTSDVSCSNCIFWGNTASGTGAELFVLGGGTAAATYTTIDLSGHSPPHVLSGSTTGNSSANPQLENSALGAGTDETWFTSDDGLIPAFNSPVIDAGTASGISSTDLVGNTRVGGIAVDRGAYEYYPESGTFSVQFATSSGFRLLASPVSTTVADLLSEGWTQGAVSSDAPAAPANVWTWNNAGSGNSAGNWTAVSDLSATVAAGQGILYYHFNDDNFDGNANGAGTTFSVTGQQNAQPSISVNTNLDGWTLVGNPFSTTLNWNTFRTKTGLYADARVWNPGTSSWILTSESSLIAPFQSFFVQTETESPVLVLGNESQTSGGTFRGKSVGEEVFEIALKVKSGAFEDEAMLRFSNVGDVGRDRYDAEKSAPLSPTFLAIPMLWNDKTYAINSLPLIKEPVSIPLAVEFTQSGKVEVAVRKNTLPEGWTVELLDTKTGINKLVGADFSYSFDHDTIAKPVSEETISPKMETMKSVSEPRFTLRVTPSKTTSNEGGNVPTKLVLEQNYPNPFNPTTVISFDLPAQSNVKLSVFDLNGRLVESLISGNKTAGKHTVNWNAAKQSSGIYLLKLEANGVAMTKKMALVK